jgi:hypothetical protein
MRTFAKLVLLFVVAYNTAWAAAPQFSLQQRIGIGKGDQWEPAVAADNSGHVYVLYPQYGRVPECNDCSIPTMLLLISNDNGKTWQPARVMLESGSGQFDAQIAVDPADHHTLFAAWLDNGKREVIVARSSDSGATWTTSVAARGNVELDKPALAVRGKNVYVAFNHEEEVWLASSQDSGRSFRWGPVNSESRPGWSLLGSATVDPAGNLYLGWASYFKGKDVEDFVALFVSKTSDAGKTWAHRVMSLSTRAPDCKEEECAEAYLGSQIVVASDSGGTLYALWNGGHFPQDSQQVYFSTSNDGGENWSLRDVVSTGGSGVEHAFPAIVAGSQGDVRIGWMDSRNAPYWNTYYRSSSNGGATWSDETRVSGYVPGYPYIKNQGFRFPFGDYFEMAIDNHGDTHIVWGEGQNYQSPGSIWHATGR